MVTRKVIGELADTDMSPLPPIGKREPMRGIDIGTWVAGAVGGGLACSLSYWDSCPAVPHPLGRRR
jgi:hypothetical protein